MKGKTMLNKLKKKYNALISQQQEEKDSIKGLIQSEYTKLWDDCSELQKLLKTMELSNAYQLEYDGVTQWIRNTLPIAVTEREYFDTYLNDKFGYSYNNTYDCIENRLGPNILVLHNGVYDQESGKTIFEIDDTVSDDVINKTIEGYMDATGYFPGVFNVDRHDNVHMRKL